MERTGYYPDEKPDVEFPFPALTQMGYYPDVEFQELQHLVLQEF
jgi:hypothetical protein